MPETAAEGAPGRIALRRFHGHDQLHEIVLEQGPRVQVRRLTSEVGSESGVRIALRHKTYRVFSSLDGASHRASCKG